MKRFKFRLQTLLDQRKAREDQLLQELGELRREEAREVERLHTLESRLMRTMDEIEQAIRRNAKADELFRLDEFVKATRDDIRFQELTIEAVRDRVEKKRQQLVNAMQDRQVLEALRDKQEREYNLAAAREELKQLDEMASVRYARGM